jgi:hypothetical protein
MTITYGLHHHNGNQEPENPRLQLRLHSLTTKAAEIAQLNATAMTARRQPRFLRFESKMYAGRKQEREGTEKGNNSGEGTRLMFRVGNLSLG